jgi:hypothetical protein
VILVAGAVRDVFFFAAGLSVGHSAPFALQRDSHVALEPAGGAAQVVVQRSNLSFHGAVASSQRHACIEVR